MAQNQDLKFKQFNRWNQITNAVKAQKKSLMLMLENVNVMMLSGYNQRLTQSTAKADRISAFGIKYWST